MAESTEQNKPTKEKLIREFRYFYDDVIGLGITRYEFGLWIIMLGFFFLRKYLNTCGNKKSMFDYMQPVS